MVLCLTLGWFPFVLGQGHPQEVAEQFFHKKLHENQIHVDFRVVSAAD